MGFMTKVTMHWDAEWIDFLISGTRQIDVHVKNKAKQNIATNNKKLHSYFII